MLVLVRERVLAVDSNKLYLPTALYEDLDDAAKRLADTLVAIKVLVEAIQAEGVNVDF